MIYFRDEGDHSESPEAVDGCKRQRNDCRNPPTGPPNGNKKRNVKQEQDTECKPKPAMMPQVPTKPDRNDYSAQIYAYCASYVSFSEGDECNKNGSQDKRKNESKVILRVFAMRLTRVHYQAL